MIKVTVGDRNYYKGEAINILKDLPEILYDRNWKILVNNSDKRFITSDNPFISLNDGSLYLPLTPNYSLLIESSLGCEINYQKISRLFVNKLNEEIIKFAEDFVISSQECNEVGQLVDKYRNYIVSVAFSLAQDNQSAIALFQHMAMEK